MAKVSNSLIGASRGRLGGVIFYRRKGENIIREHVSQIDDKNTGQQSQNRGAFILLVMCVSLLKDLIASYWVPSKSNQTPWSDCIGFNAMTTITNGVVTKYDSYGIPYVDRTFNPVNISYAPMSQAPLDSFQVQNTVAGTITFDWNGINLGIGGKNTDAVLVRVINTTKKQIVESPVPWGVTRATELETISYPSTWAGDSCVVACLIRPADHSIPAKQATKGGVDLALVVK